ncbi:hypothetical protein F5Y19DRAFT_483913 [Xylariaceae sp. FL1651]|nr:hypothetical protein F5Y19DRAFT_483913 [Xylariaceae sp. FL1651]
MAPLYSSPGGLPSPPPPYQSLAPPRDRPASHSSPGRDNIQASSLAPWQRRWNVEWLNEAMIPSTRYRYTRLQASRSIAVGHTKQQVHADEDLFSKFTAEAVKRGVLRKEKEYKRTPLHRVIRRCAWPVLLVAHDVRALAKFWQEFKNKDKVWRVKAVMEEQGENPRWQAEMTFTVQDSQFEQMAEAREWFPFPVREDIKWHIVTAPNGVERLHATHSAHWGPTSRWYDDTQPFGVRNGRVVRNPSSTAPWDHRDFSTFSPPTGQINPCHLLLPIESHHLLI